MTTKFKDPKAWLIGLIVAVGGAFWGAVESGLALPAIDSNVFNYGDGLHKTIKGIIIFATLSSIKVASTYLKKSPIPETIETPDTTFITKPPVNNEQSKV